MGASADLLETSESFVADLYFECADCIFVFLLCAAGNDKKMLAADKSGAETAKAHAAYRYRLDIDYAELGRLYLGGKFRAYSGCQYGVLSESAGGNFIQYTLF